MRVVRSSSLVPASALLAVALVFAGCNGGDAANNAPVATSSTTTNSGSTNEPSTAANNATNAATTTNSPTTTPEPTGDKVGITTTKPGTGEGAKDGDILAMVYSGRLVSGKQFDSNVGKEPFNVVLGSGNVIKGWEEGLQGIKVGEKRTLKIPSVKGYGAAGAGGDIPPNADLIFDIECLSILPAGKEETVQREALRPGTGAEIKSGQTVTFHFKGMLVNGKTFDSSYETKKPLQIKIGSAQLSPVSLEDAMVGMRVGGKYKLTIPPAVGFGAQGNSARTVPGNSVVIFEIEPLSAK